MLCDPDYTRLAAACEGGVQPKGPLFSADGKHQMVFWRCDALSTPQFLVELQVGPFALPARFTDRQTGFYVDVFCFSTGPKLQDDTYGGDDLLDYYGAYDAVDPVLNADEADGLPEEAGGAADDEQDVLYGNVPDAVSLPRSTIFPLRKIALEDNFFYAPNDTLGYLLVVVNALRGRDRLDASLAVPSEHRSCHVWIQAEREAGHMGANLADPALS
eukprot:m.75159 g.75159  ORF g.75159 m.75159 type:complete len:216 (-) comp8070_c0_seq4:232-879(-)